MNVGNTAAIASGRWIWDGGEAMLMDQGVLEAGVCKNRPRQISLLEYPSPASLQPEYPREAASRPIWHILPASQAPSHPTQFRLKLNAMKAARPRGSGTKSMTGELGVTQP